MSCVFKLHASLVALVELSACHPSREQQVSWNIDELVFAAEYLRGERGADRSEEERQNRVLSVHILSVDGELVVLHGTTDSHLERGAADVIAVVDTSTAFQVVRAPFSAILTSGDCGDLSRQLFDIRIDSETDDPPCGDPPFFLFTKSYCYMLPEITYFGLSSRDAQAARFPFWQNTKVRLAGCLD